MNSGAKQDVVGNQKEIWPQVLEKAVATLDGGYNAIAYGGDPLVAMEELTGRATSYMTPASLTLATLQKYIAAGDLIVMDTSSRSGLSYGLFNDHAYMFDKLKGTGSSAAVQLLNPWGFDQPAAIPLTNWRRAALSRSILGIQVEPEVVRLLAQRTLLLCSQLRPILHPLPISRSKPRSAAGRSAPLHAVGKIVLAGERVLRGVVVGVAGAVAEILHQLASAR